MDGSETNFSGWPFRDQLIAAPLKQAYIGVLNHRLTTFPRSIDRGSIEAAVKSVVPAGEPCFPRSIDRGSIEAGRDPSLTTNTHSFPRSIDRGSIEA